MFFDGSNDEIIDEYPIVNEDTDGRCDDDDDEDDEPLDEEICIPDQNTGY